MSGGRSSEQWREHRALLEAITRNNAEVEGPTSAESPASPLVEEQDWPTDEVQIELIESPSRWREIGLAALLVVVAALWVAALFTSLQASESPLGEVASLISMASGPLALLGIVYLLAQRTSRREAHRFGMTAAAMRQEARALDATVMAISSRIEEHRRALAEQAQQMLLLGEDATLRLTEISTAMRAESELLAQRSEQLGSAAVTARADMTRLVADIPDVAGRMSEIAALVRDTGLAGNEQAQALEATLESLALRGREADEAAGGAAQRLAAQLGRIETATAAAGRRVEDVSAGMTQEIDGALAKAADALEITRQGVESQNAAVLAMIDQAAAALARAETDSSQSLRSRLDAIGERIDSLGSRLRAQDAASQTMLGGVEKSLGDIEARFVTLGEVGGAGAAKLSEAIGALEGDVRRTTERFAASGETADALIGRAAALKTALDNCSTDLGETLPTTLARVELQASQALEALRAARPEAAALDAAMRGATDKLGETDAALARQRSSIDALGAATEAKLDELRSHAGALESLLSQTSDSARALTDAAGPQLVDALLRVRETAIQAADHARETLAAVIPEAANKLSQASATAMEESVRTRIEAQLASIAATSDEAVQAAHKATERLMRQMLTIEETTAAVEARIEENRAETEKHDEDHFARRVALLIESLNSTAIDVTKILSNDVTDAAWAAYLKGDRGIFTRRAVKLVDRSEAREIVAHYEAEPEFRDQVNRYIHDFEGMLRRVLAARDGSSLGVTLLSSDMGKLYVALAQAIERLRR